VTCEHLWYAEQTFTFKCSLMTIFHMKLNIIIRYSQCSVSHSLLILYTKWSNSKCLKVSVCSPSTNVVFTVHRLSLNYQLPVFRFFFFFLFLCSIQSCSSNSHQASTSASTTSTDWFLYITFQT